MSNIRVARSVTVSHAVALLGALKDAGDEKNKGSLLTENMSSPADCEVVANVVDLKLPWMTGFSRQVARLGSGCCAQFGIDHAQQDRVYRAGLIAGMDRAAISNTVWASAAALPKSAWEKIRLVPNWTAAAGKLISALAADAEIASYCYERLDGVKRTADAA